MHVSVHIGVGEVELLDHTFRVVCQRHRGEGYGGWEVGREGSWVPASRCVVLSDGGEEWQRGRRGEEARTRQEERKRGCGGRRRLLMAVDNSDITQKLGKLVRSRKPLAHRSVAGSCAALGWGQLQLQLQPCAVEARRRLQTEQQALGPEALEHRWTRPRARCGEACQRCSSHCIRAEKSLLRAVGDQGGA